MHLKTWNRQRKQPLFVSGLGCHQPQQSSDWFSFCWGSERIHVFPIKTTHPPMKLTFVSQQSQGLLSVFYVLSVFCGKWTWTAVIIELYVSRIGGEKWQFTLLGLAVLVIKTPVRPFHGYSHFSYGKNGNHSDTSCMKYQNYSDISCSEFSWDTGCVSAISYIMLQGVNKQTFEAQETRHLQAVADWHHVESKVSKPLWMQRRRFRNWIKLTVTETNHLYENRYPWSFWFHPTPG